MDLQLLTSANARTMDSHKAEAVSVAKNREHPASKFDLHSAEDVASGSPANELLHEHRSGTGQGDKHTGMFDEIYGDLILQRLVIEEEKPERRDTSYDADAGDVVDLNPASADHKNMTEIYELKAVNQDLLISLAYKALYRRKRKKRKQDDGDRAY